MVKIKDVSVDSLHRKLKMGKVKGLIKEVFGGNIDISECAGSLFIRKKPRYFPRNLFIPMVGFGIIKSDSFLNIYLGLEKFNLKNANYFDKTKEFAEKYEELFGEEVIINTDYSK